MSYSAPLPRDPRPHRRIRASLRAALVWACAAAAINVMLWLLLSAVGVPWQVWPGDGTVETTLGPLSVVGATLFAGLIAGLVAGVLARLVRRVVRWLILLGAAVTLASLTAPWGQPDQVPVSTRVVLTLMHISTGALVTFGVARGIWTDDRAVAT